MDAQALAAFEARAAEAERLLAVLEAKVAAGAAAAAAAPSGSSGGAGGVDTGRYVAELQGLRGVLVEAQQEQQALEKRVAELESENSKLRYQALHLKRAVQESDTKLAALQTLPQ